MKGGRWVLLSAVVLVLAAAAGSLSRLRHESEQPVTPARRIVEPVPVSELNLPARIEAQHVVTAGEHASGQLQAFLVDVGQEVFEGQLLARLSNQGLDAARELATTAAQSAQDRVSKIEAGIIAARLEASRARADAMRARTEFDRAERTYRRQRMLHDAGATPRLTYEKSEREYETSRTEVDSLDALARQAETRVNALLAELQGAKQLLEDKTHQLEELQSGSQPTEVRCPAAGIILRRHGEVGKLHDEGTPMFDIAVDLSQLKAVTEVDPSVLPRIKTGQPALIVLADLQSQGFSGNVTAVDRQQVTVAFVTTNPAVRPGMSAQVRIQLN